MPWRLRKASGSSPAKPRPSQASRSVGWAARSGARARSTRCSCTSAGTTRRPSGSPSTSTISTRSRPLIFLPASYPRGPRCGPVLTLCVSMIAAVGRRFRPAARRRQATRTASARSSTARSRQRVNRLHTLWCGGRPGPTGRRPPTPPASGGGPRAAAARRPRRAPGATAPRAWSRSTSPAGARSCRADRSCRSSPPAGPASPAAMPPGWPARTCAGPRPSTPSLASFVGSREIGPRGRYRQSEPTPNQQLSFRQALTEVELHAGLEAPVERHLVDRDRALAAVHRGSEVPGRVEVRAVVGGQAYPLESPALAVREVLLAQAGEERGQVRGRLLVVEVLDLRLVA